MLLVILVLLNVIEKKWIKGYETISVSVTAIDNPNLTEELVALFKQLKKKVLSISLETDLPANKLIATMVIKTISDDPMNDIRDGLSLIKGVTHYRLN